MSRDISNWAGDEQDTSIRSALTLNITELVGSTTESTGDVTGSAFTSLQDATVAIGHEFDWRGGLSTWGELSFQVANELTSVEGGSLDKTFERFDDLLSFDEPASDQYVQHVLNASAVGTNISLHIASTSVNSAVLWYTGYVRDVKQADYDGLVIEVGDKREALFDRPFLGLLEYAGGGIGVGTANGDIRLNARPFNFDASNDVVPIVYGRPQFCKAVVPHKDTTPDWNSDGYGLVLVFSDNAYETAKTGQPTIYIPSDRNRSPVECLQRDMDNELQYEYISGSNPIRIGGTAGINGAIVGFTSEGNATNQRRAADGYLVTRSSIPFRRIEADGVFSTSGDELDDDDTTSVTVTASGATGSSDRIYLYVPADESIAQEFRRVYARIKIESPSSETWKVNAAIHGTATWQALDYGSDPTSNLVYNNWTAGSAVDLGYGRSSTSGFTRSSDGLKLRLYSSSAGPSGTYKVYGGQFDVWHEVPWLSRLDQLYGAVDGIDDSTYLYDSSNYLENPAEIAAHFITEVLGGSVNATTFAAESAKMDSDSIKLAFQLTDDSETGLDVMDKIAQQGMCWMFSNNGSVEEIVYRPAMTGTTARAQDPFSIAGGNIIKGSVSWSMTPREDVHRGCVVNYNWNAIRGRFDDVAIIAPDDNPGQYTTNISSATEYTEFVNGIGSINAIPKIIDADYINDQATAEKLCKWTTLLYGRRRQIFEFDAPIDYAEITCGDVIYLDLPQVRVHASGDELEYDGFGNIESTSTTYRPSADTTYKGFGAVCDEDLLVIDSGSYAGSYRVTWDGSNFDLDPITAFPIGSSETVTAPWRALPAFDVLACKLVYDRQSGPRLHIKCVEHPVFLPRSSSF